MTPQYDFGMIGIGVMGSNLLLNMADRGYAVAGFDLKPERVQALEAAALPGTTVMGTTHLADLIAALKKPRKIMLLVPAGPPVDAVLQNLLPLLEKDDIVIDGGNSFFKDTQHRISFLQDKGIHFFGMGVSGGESGARFGPSLMPGGDPEAWQYLRPILESIAARSGDIPCVAYMGNNAAGHYVKMVHNGIEYAMMQLISEAYDLLRRGAGLNNEALAALFLRWNDGPLQSFLVEITASIFTTLDDADPDSRQFLVDKILDQAGSKGTGKWTSQEAMDLPVAIPTIDMAVSQRILSVYKPLRRQAAAAFSPATGTWKDSTALQTDLEQALAFCFVMAYAQGLSMLAVASTERGMNIPLPSVIRVWKAGCIIRSALLTHFEKAFEKEATLANVLLYPGVVKLVKGWEGATRRVVAQAMDTGLPVGAMASALSYFDTLLSERLPTNLIQAQRDYFGAHTYQRIDREGVFHTEWNEGEEEQ